jgi:hypothetical protein
MMSATGTLNDHNYGLLFSILAALSLRECNSNTGVIEIPENSANQNITCEGLTAQQTVELNSVAKGSAYIGSCPAIGSGPC